MLLFCLSVLVISGCRAYLKPQIRCEAGRNKGKGDEKSDCWAYGEIGTTIKLEDIFDVE